jgi:predicted HicB family RNase H-like nuclease
MEKDNRVEIELNLDEHEIYQLAMEAHKRDITLNKMIESILQEVIDRDKANDFFDKHVI